MRPFQVQLEANLLHTLSEVRNTLADQHVMDDRGKLWALGQIQEARSMLQLYVAHLATLKGAIDATETAVLERYAETPARRESQ